MGLCLHNAFAINPNDQTKNAMSAGVLRPHIDHEINRVVLVCWLLLYLHDCLFVRFRRNYHSS